MGSMERAPNDLGWHATSHACAALGNDSIDAGSLAYLYRLAGCGVYAAHRYTVYAALSSSNKTSFSLGEAD